MEKSQSYYDYSIPYRSNKSDLINLCDELYKCKFVSTILHQIIYACNYAFNYLKYFYSGLSYNCDRRSM